MDVQMTIGLASAGIGLAFALIRRRRSARGSLPAWTESLLLFFLTSAVCDAVAALGLGASLHLNPYALAGAHLLLASVIDRMAPAKPAAR